VPFELRYHPDVRSVDLPLIDEKMKKRIRKAIEERLSVAPQLYGQPLRKTLKSYFKMRVGDYRIVFKMTGPEILVLGIRHRKDVYPKTLKRIG